MSELNTKPMPAGERSTASHASRPHMTPLDVALQRRARAACQGMPYRVLAELSGFSEETIRRYMNGHKPTAAFLARICHAFKISPAWMLLGHDAPLPRLLVDEQRVHSQESEDAAEALDAQLSVLAAYVAALKQEVDRAARPAESAAREVKRGPGMVGAALAEKPAKVQEVREIRLLLGQADGQTVRFEQIKSFGRPIGDEVVIRLDAALSAPTLVAPGALLGPAIAVERYRKVMPEVYVWIDPTAKPANSRTKKRG